MPRIMVVEDEERFRRYLVQALTLAGHEVDAAADLQAAVSAIRSRAPELLVVDWMRGAREDGVQVSTPLRRSLPGLRTLVSTGHSTDELEKSVEGSAGPGGQSLARRERAGRRLVTRQRTCASLPEGFVGEEGRSELLDWGRGSVGGKFL